MSKGYFHHNIHCPTIPGKPECAGCNRRTLKISGHHRDKWVQDEETGESLQRFYVSPPCRDRDALIRQDVVVAPVRYAGNAQQLNMHLTLHTKMVSTGGLV